MGTMDLFFNKFPGYKRLSFVPIKNIMKSKICQDCENRKLCKYAKNENCKIEYCPKKVKEKHR